MDIVGQLLLVYIESSGEYSYSYRLYKCSGEEARYDRKTVMDPALENDDCYCLFDLRETKGNKYLLHFHEDGIWYEDYEKAVFGMFNEQTDIFQNRRSEMYKTYKAEMMAKLRVLGRNNERDNGLKCENL